MTDPRRQAAQRKYSQSPTGRAKGRAHTDAHQARRRAYLNAYKLERGCADCGYAAWPESLDFDHVRGEKKAQIAAMLGASWERLVAEIAKCDVVCANCHRHRTRVRGR